MKLSKFKRIPIVIADKFEFKIELDAWT